MPYVTSWLNQQLLPRPCLALAAPILCDWRRAERYNEWEYASPPKQHVYPRVRLPLLLPYTFGAGAALWVQRLLGITSEAGESEPLSERTLALATTSRATTTIEVKGIIIRLYHLFTYLNEVISRK